MKALKISANKAGKRYALVALRGAFSVWAECMNYKAGSISASWRYCEKGLTLEQAEKLFAKKIAGSKK